MKAPALRQGLTRSDYGVLMAAAVEHGYIACEEVLDNEPMRQVMLLKTIGYLRCQPSRDMAHVVEFHPTEAGRKALEQADRERRALASQLIGMRPGMYA